MREFRQAFEPVSKEGLAAAEARLGITLPAEYRTFLYTTNGLHPESDLCFTVPARGDVFLGSFYGIRSERTAGDLEYELENAALWSPLPAGYVAVGDDPGGNTLLLATRGDDAGRVFFWDRVGFWVREDGRNLFSVADSFDQFLGALRDMPR